MIKEFALDPDVLATSFRDFTYFIEKFGVAQGRVISRFPKDWKRLVYQAAQASLRGKAELSRLEVRLQRISDDVLFPTGRPSGDGNLPWIARAMTEHAREPFSAIVARDNPCSHSDVLVAREVDELTPRFQSERQRHIRRTATEIVDSVRMLLRAASTVKLIDPHFDPSRPRWARMLRLTMAILSGSGRSSVTLEIHRADNALPANLKHYFNSVVPRLALPGITVQVFLHPLCNMHNRFVLTRLGGASYHTGLDDNEDGNPNVTAEDLVTLLEPRALATEWDAYSMAQPFLTFLPLA